jgi:hypothetical protein
MALTGETEVLEKKPVPLPRGHHKYPMDRLRNYLGSPPWEADDCLRPRCGLFKV